jgi:hypothetical protein
MPITLIHKGTQKEKVSPADCALLVGIPLDRASFLDKYSRTYEGNFAQSVGDVGVELGWIGYSRLIGGIPALLDDIEALGVRVCRVLTPETLSTCIECKVLTIATQGKSAEFLPSDIVDCDALERKLFETTDGALPDRERRLTTRMNELLYERMRLVGSGIGVSTRRQLEYIRCRAELEANYPGTFRGGAGIEFSDGFRLLGEVVAFFPPDFDGIVDLTICNSLALAEMIRRRCSHALTIAMGEQTRPSLRLSLLLATMQFLKRHPGPFEGAMTRIQDQFGREE